MQGGTVQGIGWALNEEYFYSDDGTMNNSSFLDYRMPTALDLPMIDTVITEVPNPRHPYGLRGVGEAPIIPPLAAVANAYLDGRVEPRGVDLVEDGVELFHLSLSCMCVWGWCLVSGRVIDLLSGPRQRGELS